MDQSNAMDFYEKIVQGKKRHKTFDLEHHQGYILEDVEMHPVDKGTLAGVIESLPDSMFEAVEEADGDPDQAEENVDGDLSDINEETVDAFERLARESLQHEALTSSQMDDVVDALSFELVFALGTEIINLSVEESGEIRDFRGLE